MDTTSTVINRDNMILAFLQNGEIKELIVDGTTDEGIIVMRYEKVGDVYEMKMGVYCGIREDGRFRLNELLDVNGKIDSVTLKDRTTGVDIRVFIVQKTDDYTIQVSKEGQFNEYLQMTVQI